VSTAITPQQPGVQIQQWKSPAQIKDRIQAIQHLMKEVLKPGTADNEFSGDYGIIPGTGKKPSLWKSGSEQILAMFQIAVDPVVEDLSTDDCYRYRVTTRLTNVLTGEFLGSGIGECSTNETKYKWKRCYSQKEFAATDHERKRIVYKSYQNKETEEMQVRQEPADLANTILKMAKKRSQIDATLTVTGASSMFEQDLEDLPEGVIEERKQQRRAEKTQAKAQGTVPGDVICQECRASGGHLPSCKYHSDAKKPEASKEEPVKTLIKMACLIVDVAKKESSKSKKPLVLLTVATPDDKQSSLFVWHQSMHAKLLDSKGANMSCDVSIGTTESKTFMQLEKIYDINGVPYVEAKPATEEMF